MEDRLDHHGVKMKFDDLIQYKALHLEYVTSGASADFLLEGVSPEEKKKHLRNVCALISVDLFERLENTCNLLDISKRQFIEASLVECLNRANEQVLQCEEIMGNAYEATQAHAQLKEVK